MLANGGPPLEGNTLPNKCHQIRKTSHHISGRPRRGRIVMEKARCRQNLAPVALSQFLAMARFLHLRCNRCRIAVVVQFAKLLDLASNTEIAEFGETRGMRYRNWIVSDALRNKLIKSIQLIVKDIFAQNSI